MFALGCSSGAKSDEGAAMPTTPPKPAEPAHPEPRPRVVITTPHGDVAVAVEVVSTEAAVERGLMYRENLPPEDGMLFLMPVVKDWAFWMRNTLIPLDMIFIAPDMTIAG